MLSMTQQRVRGFFAIRRRGRRARPRSSRRAVARQICSTQAGNDQHHHGKTLAICLIGSAEQWWLFISMSFPSHLHFKSKRIVNLNGGIPTDLAVPTTCFAPAFIDSRFDLVHRHNTFTRILDGNLMPPTIDTTELQNVPASFCPGHLNTRSPELYAGEPRT
jgi:hypothetical protein